jgi:cytosine deaminase
VVQEFDCIFDGARLPDRSLASIAVREGRIAAIAADPVALGGAAAREDLGGALVIPGLVDGHIHLDKGFIGDRWKPHRPCTAGFDVRERVAFEKELLAAAAPMETRAAALIALAAAQGTTHMRSHVDIDAAIGLSHLETILAVREAHRELMSIELVAFPQSGILASPGTAALLDAAIAAGAGVVGGLDPAGFDGSIDGHLDVVFGLAERRGAKVDIHLHDPGMLGIFELEQIAARTRALGLAGRVAVSHAYALGDVPLDTLRRTAARLAEAGVAIMTNAPGARAFPPVLELRRAGVLVFSGNDNLPLRLPYR